MTTSTPTISSPPITPQAMPPMVSGKSEAKPSVKAERLDSQSKGQGHFCAWHGMTIGTWLRLLASRPPMHWTSLPRFVSISTLSIINSFNGLLESAIYGGRVARQRIEHPPLFILGHWRSGTTLLHNLLALDSQFNYPNLYQVMYPNSFLLTERLVTRLTGWVLPKTRPMDNMPTRWSLPQEDEMALLTLTLLSPYLMLAHQGSPEMYNRYFDLVDLTPEERQRWQSAFQTFIQKLTVHANKPIVLKSPSHTFRIPTLLNMFPDARFIYIYRDPYDVYCSGLHLRKTIFRENGLGKPNFDGMEEEVLQVYTDCIDTYERTKHLIPAGRLHELKFEDLEADPLGQMSQVYESLNLPGWERFEVALQNELPALNTYRKNTFNLDADTMRRVYSRWKSSFEIYGYSSRLPETTNASG